jgi:CubicO group peptidase (beta-lactamase class C family)
LPIKDFKMKFIKYFFTLIYIVFAIGCKNDSKLVANNPSNKNLFDSLSSRLQNNNAILSEKYKDSVGQLIDKFYKSNWKNNSLNGGFLVAKNGQIIYERYNGYANFSYKTLITESTPLHVASVSKVITATAILVLIEDKKLELDTKLNTILKSFPFPDVTIKTLLNHRSGLKNYTHFTYDKKIWDYRKTLTNQDILDILASKKVPLEYKTDTHFAYCNTNYALLALVIEKITGMTYPEAIKSMIFQPLQMTDSYVFNYYTDIETATPSYKTNNQKYGMDYLDGVYGDKNIYSTPRDLLKLDIVRHTEGFFNPDLDQKIYQGYSYESKGTKNYGLGIRMIEWTTGQRFYFHNGWWHGNTASYISLPKDGLTIIALSNKFNHATYKVKNVSVLFGDYPFKIQDEE